MEGGGRWVVDGGWLVVDGAWLMVGGGPSKEYALVRVLAQELHAHQPEVVFVEIGVFVFQFGYCFFDAVCFRIEEVVVDHFLFFLI